MGKLIDTFKQTADMIAVLDRGYGIPTPDLQSTLEYLKGRVDATTPTLDVISVKDFGAKGDGNTLTDGDKIQEALNEAGKTGTDGETKIVYIPAGIYKTTRVINIPNKVSLIGENSRATIIDWASDVDHPANEGVVKSATGGLIFSTQIRNLGIRANGIASNCLAIQGWQENCIIENVVLHGAIGTGLLFLPITGTTHKTTIKDVHIIIKAGAVGIRLDDVYNCLFQNITIDVPNNEPSLAQYGININSNSPMNTFINTHLEDCEICVRANSPMNVFINTTAGGTIIAGNRNTVFRMESIANGYTIIHVRDRAGYTNILEDLNKNKTIAGGMDKDIGYVFSANNNGKNVFISDEETYLGMELKVNGKLLTDTGLGVGNTSAASTLGNVIRRMGILDANGNHLGYIPIYDSIS